MGRLPAILSGQTADPLGIARGLQLRLGVGLLGEPWSAVHALALGLALLAVWLVTRPGVGPVRRISPMPGEPPARG